MHPRSRGRRPSVEMSATGADIFVAERAGSRGVGCEPARLLQQLADVHHFCDDACELNVLNVDAELLTPTEALVPPKLMFW